MWYKQADYPTASTAASWAVEDGLHELAWHVLFKVSKGRPGKIHAELSAETPNGQPWAAGLNDALVARMKTFFFRKARRLAKAPKTLGPTHVRSQSLLYRQQLQRQSASTKVAAS